MFCVTEIEAAAIRTVFLEDGESSAAIALLRMFPGIHDTGKARHLARQIAGWEPPAPQSARVGVVVQLRPS